MRTIGITGGVGSGKSEILSYIREHYNCKIIFADEIAHKLEEPGQICYQKLVALLGTGILNMDGTIDKGKMASVVFKDKEMLQKVNAIVHPSVKDYIRCELAKEKKWNQFDFFFLEAALLIEEHYETILDELWYIYAREDVRRERLKKSRGYSDDKITLIMKKQLPEQLFRTFCKVVIDNSGAIESTYNQIDKKLGGYL